jgi:acyl carrier protein
VTKEKIRETILRALGQIAPEADLAQIKPNLRFRNQLDIDSMDMLNFMIAIHKELEIEIPEADYPKLLTLDDCLEYLASRKGPEAK